MEMKKIADLRYMLELSANVCLSPYFEVAEHESDVNFAKFANRRVGVEVEVEIELNFSVQDLINP
jgi:hypothetical protein